MSKLGELSILNEVLEEELHYLLTPVRNYINSEDFKLVLKEKLERRGVILEFKNLDEFEHFGESLSLQKYQFDNSPTIEDIIEDLSVLQTIEE